MLYFSGVEEDDLIWGGTKEIASRLCGHMATMRGTHYSDVVDCCGCDRTHLLTYTLY